MTQQGVRSLNLSVSVAIGLFETRRQLGYLWQVLKILFDYYVYLITLLR
jgi:hypothetical protein